MIKVAFITRSTLFTVVGGDTIQVMQTSRLMSNYGIEAEVKLTNEAINYNNYDLLHFFNITRPADILYHIRKAMIPFVVSTILVNYSEYDRFYRKGLPGMLFRYLSPDAIEYLKVISRWILRKDKIMSLAYAFKGQKNSINEIIQKARLLLPNSMSEYARLNKEYGCGSNFMVIPNAVDGDLFRFDENVKKDARLIICVARIEGRKNQVNLIKALNNTKYKVLIIGAPAPNQYSYYQECRELAASNIQFIEHATQEELVGYYQKAKVHILPSWFETTGLSSLEAAAMGCNIVITDKGDTKEYFGSHAIYCSPSSPASIFTSVEKASVLPCDKILQSKIAMHYTWQRASLYTAQGYKNIIHK
jgi:glycosyltransferase involved in cell wall biosynthesis